MKNNIQKKDWNYILIVIIIIIDILSKYWISNHIKIHNVKKIFSILNLFHIHNYGAAFSLLSTQGKSQRWLLSIISTLTILIIIQTKKKENNKITAYSFIIAGAIGNLIDRIFYGFVIDFIDIHINNWHFATFNIADCSIFFGILMLIRKNH
ncbi:signal peptidase II [Buchnera aphidicola (Brachycaudus cardui)]|uniref:Lipoprotein signal peptidase n=1 Tax=Buchnera aphidicola (Brachycaudus cardui) TaxID=557993 RepID=A0A4D6Y396_9GAMM|nr:signal peptidase II [Buchnera aphidicola]QCI20301.1 signal peptidase II [Buchnera aphidicola (Brachycaudus cardui)]